MEGYVLMRKTINVILSLIIDVLPGVIFLTLIARFGLLYSAAAFLIEAALIFFRRTAIFNETNSNRHDWIQLLISTFGIGWGYFLYPVQYAPEILGLGVLFLSMLIHSMMFLVMSCFANKFHHR